MNSYQVKNTSELTPAEVSIILDTWQVAEFSTLSFADFGQAFANSEFHLLKGGQANILALARLNFSFSIGIGDERLFVAEFVGFVAVEKAKGHGHELLGRLIANLNDRNIEAVGFCRKALRPFYEKYGVPIFYDKVSYLKEFDSDKWVVAEGDDDILDLTLSPQNAAKVAGLDDDHVGLLYFDRWRSDLSLSKHTL